VLGDTGKDIGKPDLWVNVVEARGRDELVEDRGPLSAAMRAGEELSLAAERDAR
jgi:hypothetical protein|tara:strand:- start:37 stop:198 length:162 start_codon:yes stop_codon:yes gene_type:complete